MIIQGQVGSITSPIAPGSNPPIRQGQLGDVIVSELHGRYYETAYRRNMFTATLTAGTTTSAASTTTFTGLALYNPTYSTVNLVINKVGMSFIVAFAAGSAFGLQTGISQTPIATFVTTNASVAGQYVGQPAGQAVAYSSATLTATPVVRTIFGSGLTGAITTTPFITNFFDMEGSIIVPPGGFVATYTSTASGASGTFASFQYEEVPIV
jgi:hypothetical protein